MNKLYINGIICLLASSCWGNSVFYLAAVSVLGGVLFLALGRIGARTAILLFVLALFIDSSIAYCSSLIGALLIIADQKREAACFLASQLPILFSPLISFPYILLHPLVSIIIYSVSFILCCRFRRSKPYIESFFIISYGVGLAFICTTAWSLNPAINSAASSGYQIGEAISKITHLDSSLKGTLVYNNERYTQVKGKGTIYLDHDAHTQWDSGTFQQKRPWSINIPVGSEMLRRAVYRDGCLICNIGAILCQRNAKFIAGVYHGNTIIPLILNSDGRLVLGDSDFVVNCLVPYQRNLIRYLTGDDVFNRLFHFVCGFLLVFSYFSKTGVLVVASLIIVFDIYIVNMPVDGHVRYVGRSHKWAHTDLGEGVVRVLQQQGINAVFGNRNTTILVVGGNYSTRIKDEKIVVLEPGASVSIGGAIYAADVLPLGNSDGVVDARYIVKNKNNTNRSKLDINGVRIIATGTPSAQPKQLIWPF